MSGDLTTLNGLDVMRIDHGAESRTARPGHYQLRPTSGQTRPTSPLRRSDASAYPTWSAVTRHGGSMGLVPSARATDSPKRCAPKSRSSPRCSGLPRNSLYAVQWTQVLKAFAARLARTSLTREGLG